MGQRRDRLDKRLANATITRQVNSLKKAKEQSRRDLIMLSILKEGQFPYTPGMMSWLSGKLAKKASRITEEDVKNLLN